MFGQPRHSAGLVGALLLVGGNGLVSWAEQLVPTGIAALLAATVPLWMIPLGLLDRRAPRPGLVVFAGVLLGFVGVGVLVLPSGSCPDRVSPLGVAALLAGAVFWAWGYLISFGSIAKPPEAFSRRWPGTPVPCPAAPGSVSPRPWRGGRPPPGTRRPAG